MRYAINQDHLSHARATLSKRDSLYWIVGGAGSGKTTICHALAASHGIPVYDMDAHIYGAYHGRFTEQRHPVNKAWSSSQNGLAWLLAMSWEEFDNFNRAALPEYLDLLGEDLQNINPDGTLLIDGGICNPAIIAQVMPTEQIICLSMPERPSSDIWQESDDRLAMKDAIYQLPNPGEAWRKFLEFDGRITGTILKECQENNISVCSRGAAEKVDAFAQRVGAILGI
jgi:hypothetical protein